MISLGRLLRWFLFLAVFSIEVRVKADVAGEISASVSHVLSRVKDSARISKANVVEDLTVQEPDQCWVKGVSPCAIKSSPRSLARIELFGESLSDVRAKLVLREDTTLIRLNASQLRLLKGEVWIRASGELVVDSEFGAFASNSTSHFWVSKDPDRFRASVVAGALELRPRSGAVDTREILLVTPGLENWIGAVNAETGVSAYGAPIAIPFKMHLARWARCYDGGREQFVQEATEFAETWRSASVEAARIHQDLHDRKVAQIEKKKASERAAKLKVEAENRRLIELFKQKVFEQ